jgi:hypothetical protein
MKKKILLLVSLLVLVMGIIPIIGIVSAGKGQNKVDFQIHLVGLTTPPPDSIKETGRNNIVRDLGFVMMGDMSTVQIGAETITAEYLDYEGVIDSNSHLDENGDSKFGNVLVHEIYYIYDDPAQEEEDLRGTLVVMALGNNKAGTGANFVAKGTGEFEGLIIKGFVDPLYVVPNPDYIDENTTPDVPPVFYVLDRIGTAMG